MVNMEVRYICNNLCTNDWCIVYLVTKAYELSDGNNLCTCNWWVLWDGCGQFSCPHPSIFPTGDHHEE